MSELYSRPLSQLAEYEELEKAICNRKGPVQVSGCVDSQKVHIMSQLAPQYPYRLVITYNEMKAREIFEDFRLFDRQVKYYPAKDVIFYNADVQGKLISQQRIQAVKQLLEQPSGVIITTVDALMNPLPPLKEFQSRILMMAVGEELDLDWLKQELIYLGYERTGLVEEPGQFAIHGGILDIFCLTQENPYRIELWGDEIDSIRSFDVQSQRSVESLEEIHIYPAMDMVVRKEQIEKAAQKIHREYKKVYEALKAKKQTEEAARIRSAVEELLERLKEGFSFDGLEGSIRYFYEETVTFLDYFPEDKTILFLDEPQWMKERGEEVELEFRESMGHRLKKGYVLPGQTDVLVPVKTVFAALQKPQAAAVTGLEQRLSMLKINRSFSILVQSVNSYQNEIELLIKELMEYRRQDYRIVLLCSSRLKGERLAASLREYDLRAFYSEQTDRYIVPGEIQVTYGMLHRGFVYPQVKFMVLTEGDIFGKEKKKRTRPSHGMPGKVIKEFGELSVGDYVVHEEHGLGIYRGIEKVEVERTTRDFMKIEYGDGGNLYIPATQLNLIQKYADAESKKPKLSKLGSPEWQKTKKKVQTAVQNVAKELVELYAVRQNSKGYAFGEDTLWQREFEDSFPYEETQDQMDAIADTKKDMESTKIMDRLVCGDVGFGKTEIAIRAAFKAVQDGKQVVYLVPTTILAQQHYNTFCQRMKDYPVHIEMMSRFRTPAQLKKVTEQVRTGLVDIVIGTHRVLSKDVVFRDLGLLIIDEEQRFGVRHKETIKQLKKNVDVLTLTATPIPRTLHMSLIGIRDLSMLEEAPMERKPIQTYVLEYNPEMVREAINRELARGGQVYYVYNRVTDIDKQASEIAALVPDANVAFAHGQMSERELEKVMLAFINQEIDVLVTTTIIETGLDISNVNTIMIHDSDRFGLSQLYQLKGRVGRSNRIAYAFIMYRRDKILSEVAEKRLKAIREFSELGSGVKIAMRDLEIRGAGNLLGAEQHGHMEAVGYDLYCKMLNEAVAALKGQEQQVPEAFQTTVDLSMDAYIPSAYIRNESLKLDMYKRIAAVEGEEELMDLQDELIDRFGDLPKSVNNLIQLALLRGIAHDAFVTEMKGNRMQVKIFMNPRAPVDIDRIGPLIQKYRNQLKFTPGTAPFFTYISREKGGEEPERLINSMKLLLNEIKLLII